MAQHKQMAITQFKHKYQQIYLERTHTTEHQTPSSITQNFTHISSWRIIKTIQFWVKENQKRKRVPSVLLAGTKDDQWRRSGGFGLVWSFSGGLGFGFKMGERCGTVVLLCISIYSHKETVVSEYNIFILYPFKI